MQAAEDVYLAGKYKNSVISLYPYRSISLYGYRYSDISVLSIYTYIHKGDKYGLAT